MFTAAFQHFILCEAVINALHCNGTEIGYIKKCEIYVARSRKMHSFAV